MARCGGCGVKVKWGIPLCPVCIAKGSALFAVVYSITSLTSVAHASQSSLSRYLFEDEQNMFFVENQNNNNYKYLFE